MRNLFFAAGLALMGAIVGALPANAQATRTYVSGVGDDVNPCSRTAPCKTFAGAISKTAAGGIINCLDNAGYGALTITKSITVDCSPFLGGVLASSINGIIVNVAGGTVVLRGLDIEGAPTATPGLVGVNVIAADSVHIQNSFIYGFRAGAAMGVRIATSSGSPKVMISDTYIHDNGPPNTASGGGVVSVATGGFPFITLYNVKLNNNSQGIASNSIARVRVSHAMISGNFVGIQADAGTFVSFNDTDFNFNNTAILGATTTFGNNRIVGNLADGTAPTAAGAASSNLGQR